MREIILDIETTGLDHKNGHKIIEIGCFELIDKEMGMSYHQYINPNKKLTEENIKIHGITNEFLDPYPRFSEIVESFLEFIKDDIIVAHNAQFDIGFINNELMEERLDQITQDRIIDTLVIARDEFPGQQINLDSLVKKLKINSMVNREHHGALKDAKILTDVYLELRGHTQMGFNLSTKNDNSKVVKMMPFDGLIQLTKEETERHKEFIKKVEANGDNT